MFFPQEIKKTLFNNTSRTISVSRAGLGTCAYLARGYLEEGKSVAVFFPESSHLRTFSSLGEVLGLKGKYFWENRWIALPPYGPGSLENTHWHMRWASLFTLKEAPKPLVFFSTIDNLLPFWPPPSLLDSLFLYLSPMDEVSPEEITQILIRWGYNRVKLTTLPGEVSRRGDVLDVFPPGYNSPLRLEFFGDIIESIRTFNPSTQRSKEELSECVLLPISPCVLEEDYIKGAQTLWEHLWKTGEISKEYLFHLKGSVETSSPPPYPGIYYNGCVTLDKWLPTETVFFIVEPEICRRRLEEEREEWERRLCGEGLPSPPPISRMVQSASLAKKIWIEKAHVLFTSLTSPGDTLSLPETVYHSHSDLFWRPEEKKRPLSSLISLLKKWTNTKNQLILTFKSARSRERFFKLLSSYEEELPTASISPLSLKKKGVFTTLSSLSSGFYLQWNEVVILPENIILPREKASKKSRPPREKGIEDIQEIKRGELLVHKDYGIGRFKSLTRLTTEGITNDYLEIEYAGGDTLFVPVDKLNLIQKYQGPENISPPLDRLGSSRWNLTKERVKKAIETIAQDIVEMYALRKVTKGFTYPPLDEDFREFEATFPYEETPDQEQAISQVLADMDRDVPMDRLVCGDAGFGKTEVAMRAAYRAVCAGRQVVLLCPTTVLAEQHFRNFKARMEPFGVGICMLSRFVPASRQKKIIKDISQGLVDIIIGTHRLLSRDINIPRLGLIILDEEQRFGVRQKEKLKQIRKNVDVLTLSATPIPRTLQLSLAGIRDLSVIETPPEDRRPVETSIIERDREEIKNIIKREMERDGQVFWVYNRIKGLEARASFIRSILPQARVAIAHGQMKEKELEDTLHSFLLGEIDILVCTSIIEAGLDFPRANTLIVDTPQLFGLGQLYQLRGRVGRSDRQAYAYFLVDSLESLSEKSIKRLKTILEMDYLGAGFKVAMEDLKMRGAGNLLGEAQTGNMAKVGIELYMEMLEKEIKRLKGEEIEETVDPQLNIFVESNIPPSYVEDPHERMRYYKGMSSCKAVEELEIWREEMKDRFGPLPREVENLLSVLEFKHVLVKLRADRADIYKDRVIIYWDSQSIKAHPSRVMRWLGQYQEKIKLLGSKKMQILLDKGFASSLHRWTKRLEELMREEEEEPDETQVA